MRGHFEIVDPKPPRTDHCPRRWSGGKSLGAEDPITSGFRVPSAPRTGGGGGGARPPRSPFPVLANFPEMEGYNEHEIHQAIVVHLDNIMGDVRHIQSVVRYLGKLMTKREFAEQLDVRHDHLVPFANGVLDLNQLCLRNGRPDDMVMRGPTYPWVDFAVTMRRPRSWNAC